MSTTATAPIQYAEAPASAQRQPALPLRGDTILGVCEAIGQDFGFNPNFLRIPFGALLLWNPAIVIGVYLSLGLVVAVSRWFFPVDRRAQAAEQSVAPSGQAAPAAGSSEEEAEERLAA